MTDTTGTAGTSGPTDAVGTPDAADPTDGSAAGDLRGTVERFWATAEAGDWDAFADTLADDVVYTLPQTRERISGKERFVRFNREYPSGWHLRRERLVAEPGQVVTWLRFTVGTEEMDALTFFTGDEKGNIATITDFWPEPYEPPASRDHLTELTERY